MEDRYTIQSVQKALRVLRLFLESGRGFSFTDVVLACPGMNRSNVLRILSTLRSEGFLYFDSRSGLYYRGPVFIPLEENGGVEKLRRMLMEDLEAAAVEAGMIVHFTTFADGALRIICRCFPHTSYESLALASVDGSEVPFHATGAGKVYAAFADDETRRILYSRCDFRAYSPNTITSRAEFDRVVDEVRRRGYALNNCEHEEFLCCLARPVRSGGGKLLGALSFSGLRDMFQGPRFEKMNSISERLSGELTRRFAHADI